jgi:hypothetical protein
VAATAVLLIWGMGQAEATTVACFAPADVKEAQLRRMQQEFTVAALSCGAGASERNALAERYNQFVGKFGAVLRDNARVLQIHFSHHGGMGSFDTWMTKLANAASEGVATDPDYCRNAWLNLDAALTLAPASLADFAAIGRISDELVPVCGAQDRVAEMHRHKHADRN